MERYGTAVWQGGLKQGQGKISTQSKTLADVSYSFHTRFEEGTGTNPEELIGAAHAGCFSMAFAAKLEKENFKPERIETRATVHLEACEGGFSIPRIQLEMKANIPNIDLKSFQTIAEDAKAHCPISQLMRATITLKATLES